MNTPTHLLVSSTALGRENDLNRNLAVLSGAMIPDLAIYTLWSSAKMAGYSEQSIWGTLYELPIWQDVVAMGNSIFLYLTLLIIAYLVSSVFPTSHLPKLLSIVGFSALLHLAFDFPVHVQDAHQHLWPVSNWEFNSPISYWNPAYHGNVVRIFESTGALFLTIILWRRHTYRAVRGLLVLNISLYFLVPVYFALSL